MVPKPKVPVFTSFSPHKEGEQGKAKGHRAQRVWPRDLPACDSRRGLLKPPLADPWLVNFLEKAVLFGLVWFFNLYHVEFT